MLSKEKIHMDWLDYISMSRHLLRECQIAFADAKFIVCPVRGGSIPSTIVSHGMGIPVIPVSVNKSGNLHGIFPRESDHPKWKEGPFLFLDDVIESSRTLQAVAADDIFKSGHVYTACLLFNPTHPDKPEWLVPDVYMGTIDKHIVFPYEVE